MYKETEEYDLRFALNTFKMGLPKDDNMIYNALTRQPPTTFDKFLSRVNEYARVRNDDTVDQGVVAGKAKVKNNKGGGSNGKFDKSKRRRMEDYNIFNLDGYKGINTIFNKPIHKIMFDIQNQLYFEWLRQMGGDQSTRNKKLRCLYHKDHGHRTENCKTLKQFLEGLVANGHLAKYVGEAGNLKKVNVDRSDDDEPPKRQNNKEVIGVINVIHACANVTVIIKNSIRVQIKRAQCLGKAFAIEVMSKKGKANVLMS